jgi:hypothetical protein
MGSPSVSAGGASGLVGPRPPDNVTAPSDDLAVIQCEDRHGPLAAEPLYLRALARERGPGPGPQASALDPLDLVRVPGLVERLRGASARVGQRRRGAASELFQGAGVKGHERILLGGGALRSASAWNGQTAPFGPLTRGIRGSGNSRTRVSTILRAGRAADRRVYQACSMAASNVDLVRPLYRSPSLTFGSSRRTAWAARAASSAERAISGNKRPAMNSMERRKLHTFG